MTHATNVRVDDHDDIVTVAKRVLSLYSLPILALTDGPDAAYLFDSTEVASTSTAPQTPPATNNPMINPSERRYRCYKYTLPNIMDLITEDDDLNAFIKMTSSSLPEPTGLDPGTRVLGSHGDLISIHKGSINRHISGVDISVASSLYGNSLRASGVGMGVTRHGTSGKSSEIRMNPLGAGDTCAGVFLIEYLESRVSLSYY